MWKKRHFVLRKDLLAAHKPGLPSAGIRGMLRLTRIRFHGYIKRTEQV